MPRVYGEPIGRPKRRGEAAPLVQHTFFPAEALRRQRRLKQVTWCLIGKHLDDMRRYFSHGQEGLYWYDQTPKTLLELFGGDLDRRNLYILLLASTSPLENIRQNTKLALKALKLFDIFGMQEKVFRKAFRFDAHFFNIMRAFRSEPLQGPKVTSFAKNLFGPEYYPDGANVVTVDRWMMRAARGMCTEVLDPREDAPNDPEYRCVEKAVQRLAGEAGVQPRQYQAAVWVGIKKQCGDPRDLADPFESELRRMLHSGQSEFDFEAPVPEVSDDPFEGFVPPEDLEGEVMGENPEEVDLVQTNEELTARLLDPGSHGEYVLQP